MHKDIGIGLIGLGMGRSALAVNDSPESHMRVVAVCDTDAPRARAVADRHKIPFVTTDSVDLTNSPGVDVVAVYTPDHLHFDHCMAALTAGKHVVCTKPFTDSLERAVELAREADKRGVKLLVGQTARWQPDFQAVKALVDNGDLGEPRVLDAHYVHDLRGVMTQTAWRWKHPQDLAYGGLCHPVDLLRWVGGEVTEVHALGQHGGVETRHDAPDNFVVNLRFASGAIGRVLGLYGVVEPPMPEMGLSVFGTRGTAVNGQVVLDRVAGRPAMAFRTHERAPGHGGEVLGYLRHFEQCLRDGGTPLVDAWEGARTIAACAAIAESIATGQPTAVKPVGPQAAHRSRAGRKQKTSE